MGITAGPDNALWFAQNDASAAGFGMGNQIGRLTVTVNTHDFNGDGYSDIPWRDTSGNVAIWAMNGTTVLNPNTAGGGKSAPPLTPNRAAALRRECRPGPPSSRAPPTKQPLYTPQHARAS